MTIQTYTTTVDYSLSVEALVKKAKYNWANNDITSKNFPSTEKGKKKLGITLIGFNKNHSSEWIIKRLKSKGYRPATLKELLSLGVQHPEIQREDWIAALGDRWRSPLGFLHVPCLHGDGSYRSLGLPWFGGGWDPYWRFAAVKLDSGKLKPSDTKDTSDTSTLGALEKRVKKLEERISKLAKI